MASHWDVVAISAMDSDQRAAFEAQLTPLQEYLQAGITATTQFRVYEDEPKGKKIGSGGATLSIAHRLHLEFGAGLFEFRVLLIHAGGYSQRQPSASILGKLFMLIPVANKEANNRPYTLFELKLRSYEPLLRRMQPGMFLASSDTLEYFGELDSSTSELPAADSWSFSGPGFVAVAHPSGLDVGQQHGVYLLNKDTLNSSGSDIFQAQCRRVLQKPSVDVMRQEGAVFRMENERKRESVYTDSSYYMGHDVVKILLDIYVRLSPLDVELDAYGDFLQPLGSEATDEYLKGRAVNALVQDETLITARRLLFDSLRQFPLEVVVFSKSRFYHLGTFDELLHHFRRSSEFGRDFHTSDILHSVVPEDSRLPSYCSLLYSNIGHDIHCWRTGSKNVNQCLIEYCHFPNGFDYTFPGGRCILSNCVSDQFPVMLHSSVFMMTVPVGRSETKYVTVFFGVDDDLKASIDWDSPSLQLADEVAVVSNRSDSPDQFSGEKLLRLWKSMRTRRQIFEDGFPQSLWYARLFPSFDTMKRSFDWSSQVVNLIVNQCSALVGSAVYQYPTEDLLKVGGPFYSMHDVIQAKNIDVLLSYRKDLKDKIPVFPGCPYLTQD